MVRTFLILLLLLSPALAKPDLEGRQVLLIVSEERTDRDGEWLELALRGLRHQLGLTTDDLPVVRMGFKEAESAHLERLEVAPEESPVVALVRWSTPASEGPEAVVGGQLYRRAYRSAGLEKPRELLKSWLREAGREELLVRIDPVEPAPEEPEEPDPAQEAFVDFRFDEAIRLARSQGDAGLEERARRAYHQQAALALSEGRKELALSVYRELSDFYPDDTFYSGKVKELTRDPSSAIHGRWKLHSKIGWAEITAHPDGKLEAKAKGYLSPFVVDWKGHWELTGATERTFQFHWTSGNLHDITVSENEQTLQGSGLHEGRVKPVCLIRAREHICLGQMEVFGR